jgi:hypothetical protein
MDLHPYDTIRHDTTRHDNMMGKKNELKKNYNKNFNKQITMDF